MCYVPFFGHLTTLGRNSSLLLYQLVPCTGCTFSAAQLCNTCKLGLSANYINGYVKNPAVRSGREEKFLK